MKSIGDIAREIGDNISRESSEISSNTEIPEPTPERTLGDPDCRLCRGLGYVRLDVPVDHPNFGKLFPCTCRLKDLESQRTQTLRSLSNLQAVARFTFDSFSAEGTGLLPPDRQSNLHDAYERALAFARVPRGWLLLRGGYGCGKTHLAAAIANAIVARGEPVLFVTVPDLLDHLRAAYAPTAPQRYDERFEQVRTAPLLILDDLGTEYATPWALEKLFQLLNYRYMAQLPTVVTTNHDLDELDPRLRSRMADPDLVQIVTILAPDYRQAGASHAESDLNTLPLYKDMTFDSFDLRRGELTREEVDNLQRACDTAATYAADPRGWLAFTGDYGAGKTHLAAAIANARARQGHPVLFIMVPDLLDHLRAAFNPQSPVPYDKRFEEVRRAPLLILDDLGTESTTQWAQEKLYQLFNYRYVAKLPTIITTARKLENLDPKLRTRLLDVSRCTIFAILVPPYRGGGLRHQSSRGRRSKK